MVISAQLHRQRIGLFNTNSTKISSNNSNVENNSSCKKLSKNLTIFLLNILSLDVDIFLQFSILFGVLSNQSDPLLASIIGIFSTIFCINVLQFSIVLTYSLLIWTTQLFYSAVHILHYFDFLDIFLFSYYYKMIIMFSHGDIHPNPGPSSSSFFNFAHWNLNSLAAHDFARIPILETFAIQENQNLLAITESALKKDVPNNKIDIDGFSHIRNDLPPNDRCGGVVLYYKNDLPVKNRPELCIPNCIVAEISVARKKIFFLVSYRKPSQTSSDFDQYINNLNEVLDKISNENPHCIIMTGDFNAKNSEWCSEDKTDKFGESMHELFANHGLVQTVKEPTNITSRTKHCIDLVATNQA